MIITSLKLVNWRGYKNLDITFDPKLNLIIGPNGSGKTNLAESIYYLSMARSWRSLDSQVLINSESSDSYLKAELSNSISSKTIEINLSKNKKKVLINGKQIKGVSDLSKNCNVILFTPSDVSLFMESPSNRRNFLDMSISKVDSSYLESLRNYNNLLSSRNTLLKENLVNLELLSILTSQLSIEAIKITKRRYSYINELNKILPDVLKELLQSDVEAKLLYRPFIEVNDQMEENCKTQFANSRAADLKLLHTTIGPHKEDFDFILNGIDLASYGSQGQNRIGVLALKLSPYFLVEKAEDKPIIVLDDVTSELDEKNTQNLLNFVKKLSQVFITSTDLDVKDASIIDVASNIALRRNS